MEKKWLSLEQYSKVIHFLGSRAIGLLAVGAVVGISLFAAEIAFAYGLQAFLMSIGVMNQSITQLPRFIPQSSLYSVLFFLFCVGALRSFLQWAQLYSQGATAEEFRYQQRSRILKWAFYSSSVSSSQVMVLFNERLNSAAAVMQNIQTATVQVTTGLLLGLSLLFLAPNLTLLLALALLLLIPPLRWFDKKISSAGHGLNREGEKINKRLLDSIKNLLLMHIYGTESQEEANAQLGSVAIRKHHHVFFCFGALKFALPQLVGIMLICIIAILARFSLGAAPGVLLSYFYLFVRLLQSLSAFSLAVSNIVHHWSQFGDLAKWWADQAFDGLRNKKDVSTKNLPPFETKTPIGWKLRSVDFTYTGATEAVFKKFDLDVEPGKTLVVTGPSGAGKSTFLHLLIGETKPTAGEIKTIFNGTETEYLEKFRPYLLPRIGYVGAESFLIEGTVFQNLCYGLDYTPTPSDVKEALKKAECGFLDKFPNGLEHYLTEQGQGLSAGQKQRLSLARALLRKPKVLILDEATANLDHETEQKLVETLTSLKGQMTIIAVTHRQALLKIADHNLVLERKEGAIPV